MLDRIRLLQVGDVHLPSTAKGSRNVDQKDKSFSVELRNIISSVPIKVVFKQIYKIIEEGKIDNLLFMGDLTDLGSIENYEKTTAFLAHSLQLGENRNNSGLTVGLVPGNHDINRDLAIQPGLTNKFIPLNKALRKFGLPDLPVEDNISIPLGAGPAKAVIHLMNSCWGCGASEFIPLQFREEIEKAIAGTISEGDSETLRTYYDRQFDTPAFSDQAISEIVQKAATTAQDCLLVIVAHHNLLPQRLARLAPYTELVNSGALRSSLAESGRPILYLHGHIHEDPIEILSIPAGQNLVSISAPAAEAGFNVIELLYTRAGMPLACQIHPWRFNGSGILHEAQTISVSLIGSRRRAHDKSLSQIYGHLLIGGECFWDELLVHTKGFFMDDHEARLREAVELLMADYCVIVENYELDPANWIIRAKI